MLNFMAMVYISYELQTWNMSRLPGENKTKSYFIFFELLSFVNLDKEHLMSQKLLPIGASNMDS